MDSWRCKVCGGRVEVLDSIRQGFTTIRLNRFQCSYCKRIIEESEDSKWK